MYFFHDRLAEHATRVFLDSDFGKPEDGGLMRMPALVPISGTG